MIVSTQSASGLPTIDSEVLLRLATGLPQSGVDDVLRMFGDALAERGAAVECAIEAGNMTDLGALAHAISGSATTFGALRLAELAGRLGELAAGEDRRLTEAAGRELLQHIPELQTALNDYLDGKADGDRPHDAPGRP